MNGENQKLVIDDHADFEKLPVGIQDFKKTTKHINEILKIYFELLKKTRKMSTCNRCDLETLGSRPIMPKIPPPPKKLTLFHVFLFSCYS